MKYSLLTILVVAMVGVLAAPIEASSVSCTNVAPASDVCEGVIYFANPVYGTNIAKGNLKTDTTILNLTGFENLTITFHERIQVQPPTYNATPSYTCFAPKTNRTRCDGDYLISGPELNSTLNPDGTVYLLRMYIQGAPTMSGTWGWDWKIPSPPPYSPAPCFPNCTYVPPGNPSP